MATLVPAGKLPASTTELQVQEKVKVRLDVQAEPSLQVEISGYLSQGLQSLNEVEVVSGDHHLRLQILALEIPASGGSSVGYTLSSVVLRRFQVPWLDWTNRLGMTETQAAGVKAEVQDFSKLWAHTLWPCKPGDLKVVCERLVAEFDTEYVTLQRIMLEAAARSGEISKPPAVNPIAGVRIPNGSEEISREALE